MLNIKKVQVMSETEVNLCPKCGKPMLAGEIWANGYYGWGWLNWLNWVEVRKGKWRRHTERLESIWSPRGLRAYRCKECGILVCYEKVPSPKSRETPKSFLKNCVQCGNEIPIATEYCPKCGAKQEKKSK